MVRWYYLVPRLLMLGLIALAVWIGSDPLLRRVLIKSGENALGAKIDIALVRTSIAKGKVYLKDVRIADPRHPMLNIVQAEMAYIKLDPRHLMSREIVIESGKASKLQFGAPRTESGELARVIEKQANYMPTLTKKPKQYFDDLSRTWLDRFQNNLAPQAEENFESLKLARDFKTRWPQQFEANKRQIIAIQERIKSLNDVVQSKDNSNPLRTGRILNALDEIQSLQDRISQIRQDIADLQRQALNDREALIRSKQKDEQKIRQLVRSAQFDAQTVTQLLLSKSQSRNVNEIVDWFSWFRSTIPDPEKDFYPLRQRGEDIALRGVSPKPRFLIKRLDIDGEGRLAGQHLSFVGVATNLTTQPQLHDEPAGFQLRAQGQQHLIVNCTIDRRTGSCVDSFNVQCPDLNIDSQKLGNRESIAVSMEPSRLQAEIDLKMVDDQLEGELVFRHSDVLMHVDHVHDFAGGKDAALRLNQELASVDKFQTYVQISGDLDNPQFELRSDLGHKFAAAMNDVASDRVEHQILAYQKRLNQAFQAELTELDKTIRSNLDDLASLLDGEAKIISDLQQSVPGTTVRPKIR